MDQNKGQLEFLELCFDALCSYLKMLYKAVAAEATELNGDSAKVEFLESELELLFGLFHKRVKE